MTAYQTWIEGDEAPWETENDNKESAGQIWTFAERKAAHTGLTVGYGGGVFDVQSVADGTVAGLTDNATNYLVVNRSTLAVTSSTATTNWNDTTTYGRMARAVFASGVLTWNDERWSTGGIFRAAGGAGAVDSVNGQTGAVTLDSFDIEHTDPLGQFGSPSTVGNALEELASAKTFHINGFLEEPEAKTYTLVLKSAYAFTILETTTDAASGTGTATFQIEGTPLGGGANSVSTSESSVTHSGANVVSAGNTLTLVMSAIGSPSLIDMAFTIRYTRVLS